MNWPVRNKKSGETFDLKTKEKYEALKNNPTLSKRFHFLDPKKASTAKPVGVQTAAAKAAEKAAAEKLAADNSGT